MGKRNYRPSAPLLDGVASHVKQLPFGKYYLFIIIEMNGKVRNAGQTGCALRASDVDVNERRGTRVRMRRGC